MNEQQPHTGNGKLKRDLGLWAATAIVIGNMIGSGIFTAPQSLAAASNPPIVTGKQIGRAHV